MPGETIRLTLGQAIVKFMINQYVEVDGVKEQFFAGMWGIFGHGNIGGVAQALQQYSDDLPYYLGRNEQSMVHSAVGYAKLKNRRRCMAVLSSIGPGATNMVTGAATATINRVPVLLLAGDTFAERVQAPVLQQLETEHSQEVTANDTFRPVVRYFDRLTRPEQAITALPEVMRILTSPADTGAAFLGIPQDVGTYAYDYPVELFHKRIWRIPRNRPDVGLLEKAASWIKDSKRPLILAGGGVRYSGAEGVLRDFAAETGIPVAETHAGKGSLLYDDPLSLGAAGVAGTKGANEVATDADLVICIGTRLTDFSTGSKSIFANPSVRFVNINTFEMDAYKHAAVPLVGDAKATLEELLPLLRGFDTGSDYRKEIADHNTWWDKEVSRLYAMEMEPIAQSAVIGEVEASTDDKDIVVTSAGSLPGDLQKVWRCRDTLSYQVEYGYSVMGYEIPGAIGAKMAAPDREVYCMVGDGTFLMNPADLSVATQERLKVIFILIDNQGFSSVGRVSEQVGSEGFGCHYRYRTQSGQYDGQPITMDLYKIAEGVGMDTRVAETRDELRAALADARQSATSTLIYVRTDWHERIPGYSSSWWDMATAQVAETPGTDEAREEYLANKPRQRYLMLPAESDE
ncbi:3D-(3,5/4)-trihydroxycyclohexane-1,2-dione acylhydrolase (decyclizing) [Hoeflea prorocentri]|uniref:3D-(3,5/4)-trihydroxycyclohexane-1,2-dione acylhydrolase (Decyclizing) n=1 Tax=Hoeflea prorocentri TaxID=1922333 RepID=A0A9X3ZG22_9HYPH|nr:3D-(3,5/4)-trihydroxycyclohexane-1,2-dione acylhydrolase (decyclizing) [Hoeflea prorocentri]MCY6379739.1 3D-(3,5/4)-trihydroxycyclohexane-1,2-dione acylhydrolase (decyclizing) [Hoeflea prorocentri]MDA5397539.1 3D-(3,5/4)-trihydroxycyclohexane-1,2-dione acylhydrolase (decyclizing) [Hoeflea prorocentri]